MPDVALMVLPFALMALMVYILVRLRKQTPKNPALAVFLAFIFGPFGHFYLPRSLGYVGALFLLSFGTREWMTDRLGWSAATLALSSISALVMLFRVWKLR